MSSALNPTAQEPAQRGTGFIAFLGELVRRKPAGAVFGGVVVLMLFAGIFADQLAPHDVNQVRMTDRLQPPSATYWLGTDQLGRDLFSRLMHGARISVTIGLTATTLSTALGILIGVPSGFLGGRLDMAVQRFVDAFMAIPGILMLITIMSLVGPGMLQIILIVGTYSGVQSSRVIRGAVIGIKENAYLTAAEAIGTSRLRILLRHVLPNVVPPVIILFSTTIGYVILAEASLSFLGFGLPPEIPSWGGMLSDEGRRYMERAPSLAFWPGFCLALVVYCLNMFGDTLRDLLDPRLRGASGRMGSRGISRVATRNARGTGRKERAG